MNMKSKTLALVLALSAILPAATAAGKTSDYLMRNQVAAELSRSDNFRGIYVDVNKGIVTLTGRVNLYIDRLEAEKHALHVAHVDGIRNHIEIAGPSVSDVELADQLAGKLRYDRIGYGIMFNNLTVAVLNGEVTVGGKVRDYPDRDSAIAIVETTPGVKAIVDEIAIAPVSLVDDELRIRLARAIYGHPALQKYALDPQAPIRIVVENGHAELHGVVLQNADRDIAFTQANSVSGVFSVSNELMVQGKGEL